MEKKPYEAPSLRQHGDIHAATRANGPLAGLDQHIYPDTTFDVTAFS